MPEACTWISMIRIEKGNIPAYRDGDWLNRANYSPDIQATFMLKAMGSQ
jgi:hypothetical protein